MYSFTVLEAKVQDQYWKGWFHLEALGKKLCPWLSQPLQTTCVPWLVAPAIFTSIQRVLLSPYYLLSDSGSSCIPLIRILLITLGPFR